MNLAVVVVAARFCVFSFSLPSDRWILGEKCMMMYDVYSTHPSSLVALPTNHCALSLLTATWGLKNLTHTSF